MAEFPTDDWLEYPDLIDKAQELIDLGFHEEAKELLDQYNHMFTDEWEVYFLYSRILTEQNKPAEAIPFLHKGLGIDKTNMDCLLGLFYAHSMMNQVKKGSKYLLRAEKYHPENELVISSLVWYYTELNEFETAISYFRKIQSSGTANPETYRNGGLAFERSGNFAEAEECFKTALELNPQFDEVRDMLADHYIFEEKADKAIELYREALKESPSNIRLMSRLVFCYSQANQTEKAAFVAKDIIRLFPNSPVGYVDLAYVHLNKDEFDKALELADKALDIAPIDPEAYRVKGIAFSEKELDKEAEEAFEKAIVLDNENAEIMRDYYHHLRNASKFDEMEKWVQTVIKQEYPYCTEDYWFLADYYKEKNQKVKSFHYLQKAYKHTPGEKEIIPPMIDILLDRGHVRYSLPFLMKYVEKSGWNDTMHQFAMHRRLRSSRDQEGIRFLRFSGQRINDYRKYVFTFYLKRFLTITLGLFSVAAIFPVYMLFGYTGLLVSGTFIAAFILARFTFRHFMLRKQKLSIKDSSPFQQSSAS